MHNINVFLTVLEPRIQDQGASMSGFGESPILGCRLFTVSSHAREQRKEKNSFVTLIKALIPFMRALPS